MPSVNPIVEGVGQPVAAAPPSEASGAPTGPSASLPTMGQLGNFTHPDNTAMHVGLMVGVAFGIIAFFYWGGFKFAVDAGVTR
jgi:hypothetical protein